MKQILVKFSGEAFGSKGGKINPKLVQLIVEEIKALSRLKVKVAIICGGGNILRGREIKNGDRVLADYRGMRATLKNVDFLYKALVKNQVPSKVYTSFSLISKYPKFKYLQVKKDWQASKILIFAGGTGHPYFSSDTSGVLRSLELGVEIFIKATKVDGIYTADPMKNPKAKKINRLTYKTFIEKNLKVIDSTAVCLAWDNNLPIRIIKWQPGSLINLIKNKNFGSLIE